MRRDCTRSHCAAVDRLSAVGVAVDNGNTAGSQVGCRSMTPESPTVAEVNTTEPKHAGRRKPAVRLTRFVVLDPPLLQSQQSLGALLVQKTICIHFVLEGTAGPAFKMSFVIPSHVVVSSVRARSLYEIQKTIGLIAIIGESFRYLVRIGSLVCAEYPTAVKMIPQPNHLIDVNITQIS